MFRLGGPANEGITSGLGRPGYSHGGSHTYEERVGESAKERAAILRRAAGQTPDTSLSDFMIDWGLGMVGGTPAGSIFATAAQEAKQPFQRYQASKAARGAFEQKIGLAGAESAISHEDRMLEIAMKNLSKDEKIMMEKRAQLLADTLNISFAEAMKMELYKKREDPGEARKKGIEEMAMRMALDDDDSGIKYEYFLPIARQIQQAIDGVFDEEGDPLEQISGRLDRAQKYIVEEDIGERQGDDTYGIVEDRPTGDYIHNKVYFNPKDSNFYWYNINTKQFNLVVLGG